MLEDIYDVEVHPEYIFLLAMNKTISLALL